MILEADNIELNFDDKRILYGVYLKAETGKITGVLGRNGSGKTCLMKIIFGSLIPKYKNIRIDGKYQKNRLFTTNLISYLPQHQLLPNNLKLGKAFDFFNIDWQEFISIFGTFTAYKTTRANELSTGELKVIETYLVLNSKKKIILLDEPFSFVAPLYVERFKTLIKERKKESAIILTDHFYKDILDISDDVFFLKSGYSKVIKSKRDLENEGYLNINPQQR